MSGRIRTVLNLHGSRQRGELDLAQVLRRAGYNVLSFHYRGSWGSPGAFTLARGVWPMGSPRWPFLRDPTVVARFRIDTTRLIVLGHSYGGFVAVRVAATSTPRGARPSGAVESGARRVDVHGSARQPWPRHTSAFDDVDGRLGGYTDVDLAKEIVAPGYDWHLESSAAALRHVPILVVSATHDTPDDQGAELMDALTQVRAPDVTRRSLDTDHPFLIAGSRSKPRSFSGSGTG